MSLISRFFKPQGSTFSLSERTSIAKFGMADCVELHYRPTDEQLRVAYAKAYAFHPSLYEELGSKF